MWQTTLQIQKEILQQVQVHVAYVHVHKACTPIHVYEGEAYTQYTVNPEILAAIIFSVLLRFKVLAAINISVLQIVVMITRIWKNIGLH